MPADYIECGEVAGKAIQSLKIFQTSDCASELLIDFTDGTSFSCSFENNLSAKASLIRSGIGTPEILREYL